jgi:hypothetical protein
LNAFGLKIARGRPIHGGVDISAIASLSTQLSQQRATQTAELLVLKKAMQTQQAAAMTLIQSVTPASSLPAHLGQNVNVIA